MKNKTKVYYDGLCKVCSKEINHYKRQEGSDQIIFVDICAPGFNAEVEGLDPLKVHKIMHVRRADGSLATRVDAFIEIWKYLPRYKKLAQIAQYPIVKLTLEAGYTGFATIRPLLPRFSKPDDCQESPYCEVNNGKSSY